MEFSIWKCVGNSDVFQYDGAVGITKYPYIRSTPCINEGHVQRFDTHEVSDDPKYVRYDAIDATLLQFVHPSHVTWISRCRNIQYTFSLQCLLFLPEDK